MATTRNIGIAEFAGPETDGRHNNNSWKTKRKKTLRECKPPPSRRLEFQSCDHSIRHMPFPIGCSLVMSDQIARLDNAGTRKCNVAWINDQDFDYLVSNGFRDICIEIYLVHDLDLLGSSGT